MLSSWFPGVSWSRSGQITGKNKLHRIYLTPWFALNGRVPIQLLNGYIITPDFLDSFLFFGVFGTGNEMSFLNRSASISIGNRMNATAIKDLHYKRYLKILSKLHGR